MSKAEHILSGKQGCSWKIVHHGECSLVKRVVPNKSILQRVGFSISKCSKIIRQKILSRGELVLVFKGHLG